MEKEQCSNCKFYWKQPTSVIGLCRRYPPSVVNVERAPQWPTVLLNDWCGEWEGKHKHDSPYPHDRIWAEDDSATGATANEYKEKPCSKD